jgi:hypothetical protein
VFEASREQFLGRLGMNLPSINVRVSDMLDALEQVAGRPCARACVSSATSASPAWSPTGPPAPPPRAARLGLHPDESFADIIRQYIDDCKKTPGWRRGAQGTVLSWATGFDKLRPIGVLRSTRQEIDVRTMLRLA